MDAALGKIGMKLAIGAHFCGPFGGEMLSCGKSVNFVPFWTLFGGPFGGEMLSFGKSVNFVPFWNLFCRPFGVLWEIC